MNKFVNKEIDLIPEKYEDGYLIGHSGNYLLIKAKYNQKIEETVKVKIIKVEYPYCIAEVINV